MEGGSNVDGDESGGTSPSRQGAGTGILVPRSLLAMAAEIGIASGKRSCGIRVSTPGVKIGPKGGSRGGPTRPGGSLAWPPPWPRGQAAWEGGGPPPALLRASGVFWNAEFLCIFLWNFSGTVNMGINLQFTDISRQKLALGALS